MSLRTKFKNHIIPSIEKEIIAEENHLQELTRLSKIYAVPKEFIKTSESTINDLKLRLRQYQEFASDINKN